MKIRKLLSIITILLCVVFVSYITLISTGLMLANLINGSDTYLDHTMSHNVLLFNTYYLYFNRGIMFVINGCFFIFVIPFAWISLVVLIVGVLLLNKDNKAPKILGTIIAILSVLSILGFVGLYSLIREFFSVLSIPRAIEMMSMNVYIAPMILVINIISVLFYLALPLLGGIPLLTLIGTLITALKKKKEPVQIEEVPEHE